MSAEKLRRKHVEVVLSLDAVNKAAAKDKSSAGISGLFRTTF